MSAHASRKSHVCAWWALALVAAPVLYLLSMAPLAYFTTEWDGKVYHISGSGQSFKGRTVPAWVTSYSAPYRWLVTRSPLRSVLGPPLFKYGEYWEPVTRGFF
ncbi:MAG TPA: hypothetical protein VLE43_00015 [Candidatus Saccharimonadia bacterium]|nr:hypothetical protein [Candidatus Saccharimonadia bacterium]